MIADDQMRIAALSLEEKALLLTGKTAWRTWAMPQIGLREMVFSDGPVGVRGTGETPGETSDCLPSPTALAACWDTDLARRTGRWFAAQARTHGVDVVLAPLVNIQRSSIGGRHFECLSEDPELTGDIAAAFIEGIQSEGVAACVKHFVGNEVEQDRTTYVSRIDERTLREVYLAPFFRAVQAGVWSVMASYNRTDDGIEASPMVSHHHLLVDVLKKEWGFPGPVISDWTAVRETVPPALGGLDLVMPGPDSPWSNSKLAEAVRSGQVPENLLDDKVRRLLWLAQRCGEVDGTESISPEPADENLPREMAARACVVLTNTEDSLPLPAPESIRSIALIGPNAADTRLLGGGSASVAIAHPVSLEQGLAEAFPEAKITVVQGVSSRVLPPELDLSLTDPVGIQVEFLDEQGNVLSAKNFTTWSGTFIDELPDDMATIPLITSAHVTTSVHLSQPGTHWIGVGTVGRHRVLIDSQEVSSSDHKVGGEVLINSSFNIPPAKGAEITITSPRTVPVEAWIQKIDTQWGPRARAALYYRPPGPNQDESIAEACRIAENTDLPIVVVGTNEETESEGWDRADLTLPGRQDDLVRAVLAVRPDAIILVNAGAPVVMDWLDTARTVVWIWFPGQDAGSAIADILTGKTEPQGRLPWTLPDAHEHCPVPFGHPDENGVIDYTESVHVGYRGWAKSSFTPARPFGFGLGWTTWRIDSARLISCTDTSADVAVRVRNTGTRPGSDVIQAYLKPPLETSLPCDRPVLWLAGHSWIQAGPGEDVETVVSIPRRAFEVWQPGTGETPGKWVLPLGTYTLAIGHNALDLSVTVEIPWTHDGHAPE